MINGFIFGLDRILVNMAVLHFQAWRRLAEERGAKFTWEEFNQVQDLSPRAAMDLIFEENDLTEQETQQGIKQVNQYFHEHILGLSPEQVLPGVEPLLKELHQGEIKIGLGSASKEAQTVLEALGLSHLFDVIEAGHLVERGKVEPDLLLSVVHQLGAKPENCVAVEADAEGIEAARRAGMYAVGIGYPAGLPGADVVYPSLRDVTLKLIKRDLDTARPY